jgi:hypothetical protein
MLPSKTFALFLVEYEFLLARLKSMCDFLDQQVKGIRDVALPSRTFEIATIFYFSFVVLKEGVVHLYLAYPDCRLRREWDTTTFYFPANILCLPHVRLSLFIDHDYPLCSLFIGIVSGVGFK